MVREPNSTSWYNNILVAFSCVSAFSVLSGFSVSVEVLKRSITIVGPKYGSFFLLGVVIEMF